MTKSHEDEYVTNRRRAEIANAAKSDLFLRLHTDAASVRGFAIYYPNQQGRVEGRTGPSPLVIEASREAAELFHAGFAGGLKGFFGTVAFVATHRPT